MINEMALVEYLLKKYSFIAERCNGIWVDYLPKEYYKGKRDQLKEIIQDRFGMTIRETDTEYIAENSVCSVRVKRSDAYAEDRKK